MLTLLVLAIFVSSTNSAPQHKTSNASIVTSKHHVEPYWSYQNISDWPSIYPLCGKGRRQSPIYLAPAHTFYDSNLVKYPLHFDNYLNKSRQFPGVLSNDGRNVKWTLSADRIGDRRLLPRISGSGLGSWYLLDHIDFHWGDIVKNADLTSSTCSRGSDHVIGDDFTSTPIEIHFVHYNAAYKHYKEARNKSDGLAIIAFLINKAKTDAEIDADFSQVSTSIGNVSLDDYAYQIYLNLGNLLPFESWGNSSKFDGNKTVVPQEPGFYRYFGSLTMPPCYESVKWTVFSRSVLIDPVQMVALMSSTAVKIIEPPSEMRIINNYRPIQSMNMRTVTTNSLELGNQISGTASLIKTPNASAIIIGIFMHFVAAALSHRF